MKAITLIGKIGHGKSALVDDDDYEELNRYRWNLNNRGYARRSSVATEPREMHVLINKTPDGLVTDHINGNKLDNRKVNLRSITRSQNCYGQRGRTDRPKGVRKQHDSWTARLRHNGKEFHLGSYGTVSEAVEAYNEKATEIWGPYARLSEIAHETKSMREVRL